MSVFKNGRLYHYEFFVDGRRHRGSTCTANKQLVINEERKQRERLEKNYGQILQEETREHGRKTYDKSPTNFWKTTRPSTAPSPMPSTRWAT